MFVDMQNWALDQAMLHQLNIPAKIKQIIDEKPFVVDDIGMSGNQVLIFEDMVLKIENNSKSVTEQVEMMQWLEGKLPVHKYLLMKSKKIKVIYLCRR